MSKRSSRRKRQQRQKKQEAQLTAAVLAQQGYNAFQQADYDGALKAWEHARRKPNAPPALAAARAEAYFRRAVSDPAPKLADLQRAVDLQPGDQLYRYHLALAHHRLGELAQAEPVYRRLLAESPPFKRAVAPLAQLLIEQKKPVAKDPVWQQLNAAEQLQLAAAEALIKKKAISTWRELAGKPLDPFWAGLVALALDDPATARQQLQEIAKTSNKFHPLVRGVARYYLGTIAAEAGQIDAALAQWQAAQADGLDSPHLRQNLAALAYEQAVKAQQAGQPQRAVELLEQVGSAGSAGADLRDFYHQLNLELGYVASQQGDWPAALSHWQKVEQAGDPDRKLILNLALAYQHQERYLDAAEYWRTLLRRRPRKATHPDALTDEQVARLWQNVADNYSKAEDYDEAIKTYKNAVKWAPDNIDLRLKLVEAYQNEGRWQAAENELHRILEKEPDHIRALTLLGESYSDDYFPDRARKIWLRILELEPNNPVARQQLAHLYEEEGLRLLQWRYFQKAINVFKEGLEYVPDSQRLLVVIGGAYVDWGKLKQARQYLEQARAVNPNDLHTLHTIYNIWLGNNSIPEMQQTFEQIKAVTSPIPGEFFIDLFQRCYQFDQLEEAEKILQFAEERYSNNADIQVSIATGYLDLEEDNKALAILRRALKNNPDHVEANIQVGILYHHMDQSRLAKRHWDRAETQARKKNDQLLLYRIKSIKDELLHGKPAARSPIELLRNMPAALREELLKQAPPEVAALLGEMDLDMLEMMFNMGGFDDEFFDDEDDFYYV